MTSYITAPSFNPVLLELPGPLAISWYGTMYLFGFLTVFLFLNSQIKRDKLIFNRELLSNVLSYSFIGVLLGGRLGFVFFVEPSYYFQNPGLIFKVWDGGMYFFGGLIGVMLAPLLAIRRTNVNYFDLLDVLCIPVPLALAFGRMGNFINGEFWGKTSRVPWAMVFKTVPESQHFDSTDPEIATWISEINMGIPASGLVNLPRHPVQLYELILEGIILFLMLLFFRNARGTIKPRGSMISLFLFLYGAMRFWLEFYRHPVSHSALVWGSSWFTLSMLFSLPMILLGALGIYFSYRANIPNKIYPKQAKNIPNKIHPKQA